MRSTVSSGGAPCFTRRARLGLVLEDDDLVAPVLAYDVGAHDGAVHERAADGCLVAVGDEQDALEVDGLAGLDLQALDLDLVAELDAVLLAARFDDCVHGSPELIRRRRASPDRHSEPPTRSRGANRDGTRTRTFASTTGC